MNKLLKIAKQEFKMITNNKTFIITTLLGPFFLFAVAVLPTLLGVNAQEINEETYVGIVAASTDEVKEIETVFSQTMLRFVAYNSVDTATEAVTNGELNGFLHLPANFKEEMIYNYYSKQVQM